MGRCSLGSRRVRSLINLMADPTNAMTQREMADALGVSPGTIRRWKRIPGFADALYRRLVELTGADLHRVFRALMRQAVKGDVRAAKMLLDLVGRLAPAGDGGAAPGTLRDWVEAVALEEECEGSRDTQASTRAS